MLFLPFVVALLALGSRIVHHQQCLNHDVAMFLQCAKLLLANKQPYVDFVDLNPPLIFYLSMPAVLLGRLVGTLPIAVFLLITLLILYSLVGSFVVLHKKVKPEDWSQIAPVLFGFLIFNLTVFSHFGQREHLFVLMFMPFFLMRWLRQQNQYFGPALAVPVGVVAGIGISLKLPYFVLVPLALEMYRILIDRASIIRLKDPEVIAATACMIMYGVLFLVCEPYQVTHAFLARWAPLTVVGYDAYFCTLSQLFLFLSVDGSLISSVYSLAAVCLVALFLGKRSPMAAPLLVWTISGWFMYLIQQKGWAYHTIPMMSAYFMLANLELAVAAKTIAAVRFRWIENLGHLYPAAVLPFMIYSFMLILALPFLIRDSFATGKLANRSLLKPIRKYTLQGAKVLTVVSHLNSSYPDLVQSNREPASRYLWAFPLVFCRYLAIHAHSPVTKAQYQEEQRHIVDEICDDIAKTRPDLIAIWKSPPRWDFSWTVYSSLDTPRFENILCDYRPVEPADPKYSLWVRR